MSIKVNIMVEEFILLICLYFYFRACTLLGTVFYLECRRVECFEATLFLLGLIESNHPHLWRTALHNRLWDSLEHFHTNPVTSRLCYLDKLKNHQSGRLDT